MTIVLQYRMNIRTFFFSPVLEIKEKELLNEKFNLNNSEFSKEWVSLIKETIMQVKGPSPSQEANILKPFGFKNTGSIIVMYTNTPNNSLPLIFVESESWFPLFKRHSRD